MVSFPASSALDEDSKRAYLLFMTTLAQLRTDLPVPPAELYARWADPDTHPAWSHDLAWVRLEEPLAVGARGHLRPKGGPRSRFTVTELVPDRTFADTTHLPGARLTFRHEAVPAGTGSRVTVTVTVEGPLSRLWARILGPAATQEGIEKDLTELVGLVGLVAPEGSVDPAGPAAGAA
jgi:uncharacterized protein YndB with AHSA1/START domain